jgi:hypothetical protein
MAKQFQQNAIGALVQLALTDNGQPVDLSTSTSQFFFRRPSGNSFAADPVLSGTAQEGKLEYATRAGDLDEFGWWEVQALVRFDDGRQFPSAVQRFEVLENIRPPDIILRPEPVSLSPSSPLV